jgi:hypothetical protein
LLICQLAGGAAQYACWPPAHRRRGAEGQERERENGHIERFDELDCDHRSGKPEKTATCGRSSCSEQPDQKAAQTE